MGDNAAVCEVVRKASCWTSASDLVDDTIHSWVDTVCEEKPTLPDREFPVRSWNARAVRKSNFFVVSKLMRVVFVYAARQE